MDLTGVAVELLDSLPAHRTLGVTVLRACDGIGEVRLPVTAGVQNVIGSLHSSGITALADAAGLAALVGALPDAATARRLRPLGTAAELEFRRPVRGTAVAQCVLSSTARAELARLVSGKAPRAVLRTSTVITAEPDGPCASGSFTWSVRLTPHQ